MVIHHLLLKKGKAPKKNKHQKKAPLSYTALEPFVDSYMVRMDLLILMMVNN